MARRLYWWLRRRARDAPFDLQPRWMKKKLSMVSWTRERSDELFYVFQGRGMRLMMDPMDFLRETGMIHVNLVMLRDYQRFFYHAGLNSEIADFGAILERLRAFRQEMPHVRHSFCMGSSSGGYAALLFGHYLKVHTVFAFAPQTLIDLELLRSFTGRSDTWRFPEAHLNLGLLMAEHNGQTRYKVFYCEGRARDRAHAERIGGCPGVELYPQPGSTHLVIEELYKAGRLREVIARGA
jgi:hypothetical protein